MPRRTWSQLTIQYADNASGDIDAGDLRDGVIDSQRPNVIGSAPTSGSDNTDGYDIGHRWLDTSEPALYECTDASTGAAVWAKVWPQSGTTPAWGDITGTLSAQTDLQNALDNKLEAGDELTDLAATGVTAGYVPKADGNDGIVWAAESGGGGGGDLTVVHHGSNASETRPGAPVVYWMGSVPPSNRQTGDLWLETGAFD